ncbi:MAG: DNA polymerase IV [Candidatus Omnitrophota bacterium]
MSKIIMHIDMDAFFASVETRDNPALKGKPVAVAGANQRTVIVSPSYEARVFGVKTGMTKSQARSLCPSITFITANTHKYTRACSEIVKILYSFTPDIEVYSIDEFFIDVTNSLHLFGPAEQTAQMIKDKIKKELKLPCTVGISYNKLLAKIASDNNKPDGLFEIDSKNKNTVIGKLDVSSIWGIGPSTSKKLYNIGVVTLNDLKSLSMEFLNEKFGMYGLTLYNMARGIWDDEVVTADKQEQAKSIGHSMTFSADANGIEELRGYLLELCKKVAERLRRENLKGKCVSVTVRYKSFKTFSRQKSTNALIDTTERIYKIATDILKSIDLKEPVRLLGVSISRLRQDEYKGFLFKEEEKRHKIDTVLDQITAKFGNTAITLGSLVNKRSYKRVISPAWRPSGARNY